MSTTESNTPVIPKRELKKRQRRLEHKQVIAAEFDQYRTLSLGAVFSLAISILSIPTTLVAHLNPLLPILPFLGTTVAAYTVFSLRRRKNEYVGMGYARLALVFSSLSFGIGTSLAIYTYATEVPEGYERISFSDLQPPAGRKDIPYSPKAAELSESKVFVKGYVYPDEQIRDIKRFVLVPDMGTCCFGGQPKLTDMIQVTLEDPLRTEYSYARRSFAGTFRLAVGSASKVGQVIYHLDADYVK